MTIQPVTPLPRYSYAPLKFGQRVTVTTARTGTPRLKYSGFFVDYGPVRFGAEYTSRHYLVLGRKARGRTDKKLKQYIPLENIIELRYSPNATKANLPPITL